MHKTILLLIFIYFSFASMPGTPEILDFEEKKESILELVETEDLELNTEKGSSKELIDFVKTCVAEAFRGRVPNACYNSQLAKIIAQKLRPFLGIKTNLKNFQFMIDENGKFCYSYHLARKKETRISKCLSIDEIIDKIFLWVLFNKQDSEDNREKSDQQLFFGLLLSLLLISGVLMTTFTALHYCQFKYRYLRVDKIDDQVKSFNLHCSKIT